VESILLILQIVALLCVSALCVYLIVVLTRAQKVLTSMHENLSEFGQRSKPILENLEYITERTKSIATKIDDQAALAKGSLEAVKKAADNILEMEERIQQTLEEPVLKIGSVVAAIVNRLSAYFDRTRHQE